MGKASVEVTFQFPKFFEALQASQDRIERVIASTIQTQVGMRFDAEGAYNGHEKWKGLKMRQGQILSLTGTLRKSISPPSPEGQAGPQGFVRHEGSVMDLHTEVGSKVIYASVHDKGAVIVPKTKKALRFFKGSQAIFAKRVEIPKREFTDMNAQDTDELEETLANLVAEILEGA